MIVCDYDGPTPPNWQAGSCRLGHGLSPGLKTISLWMLQVSWGPRSPVLPRGEIIKPPAEHLGFDLARLAPGDIIAQSNIALRQEKATPEGERLGGDSRIYFWHDHHDHHVGNRHWHTAGKRILALKALGPWRFLSFLLHSREFVAGLTSSTSKFDRTGC